MKNILVPLGLSEDLITISRLQYAIDLATKTGGVVHVVKVYKEETRIGADPLVHKTLKEITQTSIERIMAQVDKKEVTVNALPLEGELLEVIPAFNLKHAIDLIILGPESMDIKDPFFLGETTGSIVKKTEIPVLIVPEKFTFQPIKNVLMAVKSGVVKKENALLPIKEILTTFNAEMKLLQVKTADFLPQDEEFHKDLKALATTYKSSENATIFQGVLEHLNEFHPDLICVFRRKRGFFAKLWEDNVVLKKDFESRIPLLILRGAD